MNIAYPVKLRDISNALAKRKCMLKHLLIYFVAITLSLSASAQDAPPAEQGIFRRPELVELVRLDQGMKLDIRYATSNNFLGEPVYREARAFLQRPAAEALMRAHKKARAQGYGFVIYDAYRPWSVTKLFWERFPNVRAYLADPVKGSRHNRGCAVDLSLFDLITGRQLSMPSEYDDFSEKAHPEYRGGTQTQRHARDQLRAWMESEGFTVYENEWWHFDCKEWREYPLMNIPYSAIGK